MIFLLFAGAGLLFGLGSSQGAYFERKVAEDIRSKLQGEHRKVEVRSRLVGLNALVGHLKRVTITASDFSTPGLPLFTEPDHPKSGAIDELRIELLNFDLKNLHIDRLYSSIPDCRFDFGQAVFHNRIRLTRSGTGRGSVQVSERNLEYFILKKFHEIKEVHVKIGGGRVAVSGYGEFLLLSTHFAVDATLSAVGGTRVNLTDAHISFDGKAADELSSRALLSVLNPVVDFDRDLLLYGAISLDRIKLENAVLVAEGRTMIPAKPRTQ